VAAEAEVRRALADLDAAFDRGDLAAVRELCTEDVVFIGSGEGEELVGRDAIEPTFAALAERVGEIEFALEWESVDVEVLGGVALVVASAGGRLKASGRETLVRYRLTGVLVERDGRWLWRLYDGSEPGRW
jgi:uncharacterized protein (TIGR02246 family)